MKAERSIEWLEGGCGWRELKQMLEVSGEECPMIAIILLHWTLIVGLPPILGWTRTHCAVDAVHRKMSGEQFCLPAIG